jgi:hypothetical protein
MSDQKTPSSRPSAGSPDSLTEAASVALSESELEKVTGSDGVSVNKAKTADKAYTQMDGYIKQ